MSHPGPPEAAAHLAHHPGDVSGGWLRAAVFGAMDGLVTNIALIAGVGGGGGAARDIVLTRSRPVGGGVAARDIVLTGSAGLVAGAISMGLGEFTSVRAQNEQVAAEVAAELREL